MDDALERNQATATRMAVLSVVVPVAVFAVVLLVIGYLVGGVLIALVAVLVVAAGGYLTYTNLRRAAPVLVLAATGARAVGEDDEPRLHNLVEGLCVGVGLEAPQLWLVEDPAANALAVAQTVDDAHLVVTRGLLDRLSLVELEAVLAHELARIRRGEAIVGALAVPVLGSARRGDPALAVRS